jgi:hypothetical protein
MEWVGKTLQPKALQFQKSPVMIALIIFSTQMASST